jgi:DNA-dependent RNA polymerase auxiliary subunit epsilon
MSIIKNPYFTKTLIAGAIAGAFALTVNAADVKSTEPTPKGTTMGTVSNPWSDRQHMGAYGNEKDRLEEVLKAAMSKDDVRKLLKDQGYIVTSINEDSDDEVEYEIVKGDHSYELEFELDNAGKPKDIGVSTNMWRADATKKAMKDHTYNTDATSYDKATADRYRDRTYMTGWTDEKEQLEKELATGKPVDDYKSMLEKMGYQITSINDAEADYVEMEIVKGDHSYEVQLDRDEKTQIVNKVDVTTNMWQSDETERALGQKKGS